MTRILLINGHPDPRPTTFIAALAAAYEAGARDGGHEIRRIDIGALEIPFIGSAREFAVPPSDPAFTAAQDDIAWAEHLVFVFPLWLAAPPARLKAFLEQTFRYGFAFPHDMTGIPRGLLSGRSARVVATMGTPNLIYRLWFGATGVRAMEDGVLKQAGIRPVRRTLFGGAATMTPARAARHIETMKALGRSAR